MQLFALLKKKKNSHVDNNCIIYELQFTAVEKTFFLIVVLCHLHFYDYCV